MFEELLKQWANEQGFQTWSQDHAAVLRNLTKWLNMHAVEHTLAVDGDYCACKNNPPVYRGFCIACGLSKLPATKA